MDYSAFNNINTRRKRLRKAVQDVAIFNETIRESPSLKSNQNVLTDSSEIRSNKFKLLLQQEMNGANFEVAKSLIQKLQVDGDNREKEDKKVQNNNQSTNIDLKTNEEEVLKKDKTTKKEKISLRIK
jgi:hypothetical protein